MLLVEMCLDSFSGGVDILQILGCILLQMSS